MPANQSRLTLWGDAWAPERIPAYPTFALKRGEAGETTFYIKDRIQIASGKYAINVEPRPAEPGELLRDRSMAYLLDTAENQTFRMNLYHAIEDDPAKQLAVWQMSKSNILFWINTFVYITNPKNAQVLPFVTFPKQDEFITWCLWLIDRQTSGLVEKSREQGYTWMVVSIAAWLILFHPQMTVYLMSLTQDDVDDRSMDSLFGKLRFVISMLPPWMQQGFAEKGDFDKMMQIQFPENKSLVSGVLSRGTVARGGRAYWMVWDEAAHAEQDSRVREALPSLSRSTMIGSTPKGAGNEFFQIAHDPRTPKMQLHYADHPLKNPEWKEIAYNDPLVTEEIWGQEQEIQYETSQEGRVFPQFISFPHADLPWSHVQEGEFVEYDPNLPVDFGGDLGTSDPCAIIFFQIKPMPGFWRQYTDLTETVVAFSEIKEKDMTAIDLRYLINLREYHLRHNVVDLRTGNSRGPEGTTWRTNLSDPHAKPQHSVKFRRLIDPGKPILTTGQRNNEQATILNGRELLNTPGAFAVNKHGCPGFIQSMQNWAYPLDPNTRQVMRGASPTHAWSDFCKAFLYYVDWRKTQRTIAADGPSGLNYKTPRRVYR
jgi:hypothetical protein